MVRDTRGRAPADSGAGLVELTVTMSLMAVVGAVFITGLVDAYRSSGHSEVSATASNQLSIAFEKLDREVRYASAVSLPGTVGSDQYVEFAVVATGTPTCTQMRLNSAMRQLQQRSWLSGTTPAPGGWVVLASGVSSTRPFQRLDIDLDNAVQRLEVTMVGDVAPGASALAPVSDVTFSAANSSAATANDSVCSEGRSVA